MTKTKFTQLRQPFILTVLGDSNPADLIRTIRISDYDGTDAYELNLMNMDRRYLNEKDLKAVFRSTLKPIMVCFYRWDYHKHIDIPEEERVRLQIEAVRWGAAAMDLEGDSFDPIPGPDEWTEAARKYAITLGSKPRDLSMKPEAIKRQKEIIAEVHRLGGEVLMSAHTRVRLSVDESVRIAKEMESRGPDMVKVVKVDTSFEELLDTMRATVEMKKVLKVPFFMMSHGDHSKIGRVVCPMLGSMLAVATQPVSTGGFPLQPPIRCMKAALENIDWSVTKPPEEQRWL